MRENRPYGLEGGESAKRTSLPLCRSTASLLCRISIADLLCGLRGKNPIADFTTENTEFTEACRATRPCTSHFR
jgi:hypothetical protein